MTETSTEKLMAELEKRGHVVMPIKPLMPKTVYGVFTEDSDGYTYSSSQLEGLFHNKQDAEALIDNIICTWGGSLEVSRKEDKWEIYKNQTYLVIKELEIK